MKKYEEEGGGERKKKKKWIRNINKNGETMKCEKCGKQGHGKENCWELHPEKAPKKVQEAIAKAKAKAGAGKKPKGKPKKEKEKAEQEKAALLAAAANIGGGPSSSDESSPRDCGDMVPRCGGNSQPGLACVIYSCNPLLRLVPFLLNIGPIP